MKKSVIGSVVLLFLVASVAFAEKVETEVELALAESNEVSVIILLEDDTAGLQSLSKKEHIAAMQDKVINSMQPKRRGLASAQAGENALKVKHRYATINGLSGTVSAAGLEALRNNSAVRSVVLNKVNHLLLDDSAAIVNATAAARLISRGYNITGSGETVCVIDSGIDYTHPDLGGCSQATFLGGACGKVLAGHDYKNNDVNPLDDQGHGTHVAGIIASEDVTYRGVAPGAKLVALKVCDHTASGNCLTDDIVAAIDWCVDNSSPF